MLLALLLSAAPLTDPCGDPMRISQAYRSLVGLVVEVTSGDSFRARIDAESSSGDPSFGGVQTFRLVAVEAPAPDQALGKSSKQRLTERLMGRTIGLALSPVQKKGTPYNVFVHSSASGKIGEETENEGQLAAGLAREISQGPYDIDSYLRCTFKAAQERGKKARLGIWNPAAPIFR